MITQNHPHDSPRAPRNRTLTLSPAETARLKKRLVRLSRPARLDEILDRTIHQDLNDAIEHLPERFVDLLFIDPPYNLNKTFASSSFRELTSEAYLEWLESWFPRLLKTLKPTASVYVCGDWKSSGAIQEVLSKHLIVRNRITWEREKGRGALTNWKNCSEDIWFATRSDRYTFNVEEVKLKRRVLAPYVDESGAPKDWQKTRHGSFRLTAPSNLWTDLTVPFWSMPENTDHPTQKPEKLLAKILLASTGTGDVVLDPFLGSGTTSVVARKLGRRYVGIELDPLYCAWAEKRLELAREAPEIQGYRDGVFWERNSG